MRLVANTPLHPRPPPASLRPFLTRIKFSATTPASKEAGISKAKAEGIPVSSWVSEPILGEEFLVRQDPRLGVLTISMTFIALFWGYFVRTTWVAWSVEACSVHL